MIKQKIISIDAVSNKLLDINTKQKDIFNQLQNRLNINELHMEVQIISLELVELQEKLQSMIVVPRKDVKFEALDKVQNENTLTLEREVKELIKANDTLTNMFALIHKQEVDKQRLASLQNLNKK